MSVGVHIIPSLEPLHVHVISEDLCSPCVRTRKHYNSFATDFFYPLKELADYLRVDRRAMEVNENNARAMLSRDPECHRCGKAGFRDFAAFKEHLQACEGRMKSRFG